MITVQTYRNDEFRYYEYDFSHGWFVSLTRFGKTYVRTGYLPISSGSFGSYLLVAGENLAARFVSTFIGNLHSKTPITNAIISR